VYESKMEDFKNLLYVGGALHAHNCQNLKSFGKLKTVGGDLDISRTTIDNFGVIEHIKGDLLIKGSVIDKMYSYEQIKSMVKVDGVIFA
jgi:hypothetical protein